jgi:cytochrome c oxidase subunit 3
MPRAAEETNTMAQEQAQRHPYHLVEPSPWPILGALSLLLLAFGLIAWIYHLISLPWVVFGAGALGVVCALVFWWRDVIHEAESEHAHTPIVQLSLRYGMVLFICSEVMFFVAWFWAYFNTALFPANMQEIVRAEFLGGQFPPKDIKTPDPLGLPLLNTIILVSSGATVTWAHRALLKNNRATLKGGLACTILLGILFTCFQALEFAQASFAYSGNIYGTTFFMATGFHGAHVIIGTTFLIVCLARAFAGHFTPKQHLGFEFAVWYWHFVDVVWLLLFAFIYVWRGA